MFNSLSLNILVFVLAAIVIAFVGVTMTKIADKLAAKTGLGEAIVGAIFLGGSTSLPGIITSVSTAAGNHPQLAISNALGGIAAQTAFLGLADIVYSQANLEYAAASATILSQGTLLITFLVLPLMAIATPEITLWQIHPVSFLLPIAYVFGLRLVSSAKQNPMWLPKNRQKTESSTEEDVETKESSLTGLGIRFALCALVIGLAGYVVAESGVAIVESTNVSESVVGGLFTAVCTSLPELVTSIAAVKQGALTLAVGGIIGGNSFDVLFMAFADFAYRQGSIYHALTQSQSFIIALTILMTSILLLGLLRREKYGIGNIGFESFLILVLYCGGFLLLFFVF